MTPHLYAKNPSPITIDCQQTYKLFSYFQHITSHSDYAHTVPLWPLQLTYCWIQCANIIQYIRGYFQRYALYKSTLHL